MNRRCGFMVLMIGFSGCLAAGAAWSQSTPFGMGYHFPEFELPMHASERNSNIAAEFERGIVTIWSGWPRENQPPFPKWETLLLRVDQGGDPVLAMRVYAEGHLSGSSVVRSHDDDHIIAVGTAAFDGIWVAKIAMDSMDVVWSQLLGSKGDDAHELAYFVFRLPANSLGATDYLIVGEVRSGQDIHQYLARVTDDGELYWARRYDRSSGSTRDFPSMALVSDGTIYVTGVRGDTYPYVMGVDPTTGDIVSEVYYYSHPSGYGASKNWAHLAENVSDGGHVLTYSAQGPSIVAIFLDRAMEVERGWLYRADGPDPDWNFWNFGASYIGNEIVLNTQWGGWPGRLRLDSKGVAQSHHIFEFDFVGQSVPMSVLRSGSLAVRAEVQQGMKERRLWLVRTDGIDLGPCSISETDIDQDALDEFGLNADEYTSVPWGEIGRYRLGTEQTEVSGERCP